MAAFYYRKVFPSQVEPPREWPPEDEQEEPWWEEPHEGTSTRINYTYKPRQPDNQ